MKDDDTLAGRLEDRSMVLQKKLDELEEKIQEERKKVSTKNQGGPGYRLSIEANAQSETEVELVIIYGTRRFLSNVSHI